MLSTGVNSDCRGNGSSLAANLSEQIRQSKTGNSQEQNEGVAASATQVGSSRRTLLQELEDTWDIKVGVTAVGPQGNKSFAMGMVNAGVSRSVGISPGAMQRMNNDPAFKEKITQDVAKHIETFDRMMSSEPGKNKAYGLMVDDEGNISSWSYVETTGGNDSKDEYWDKLKEKIEKERLEKLKEQKEQLEEKDEQTSQDSSIVEADDTGLSDLVKAAVIVDITA